MKTIFIALAAVLGIFLIAGGVFYFSYFGSGPLATLIIDSGSAQYKIADTWKDATSGMTLKQGYSIKDTQEFRGKDNTFRFCNEDGCKYRNFFR